MRARISKEVQFDAGHRVPNHVSKCRHPHGHRYRVVVHCVGPIIEDRMRPDDGMLVDFGDLKSILNIRVVQPLDHAFIISKTDLALLQRFDGTDWRIVIFPYVPTAENIARWIWTKIEPDIQRTFNTELELQMVEVWETPSSAAYYTGGV